MSSSILLVQETQIHPFSFYQDGSICRGMSLQNELYRIVTSLSVDSQQQTYALAYSLMAEGKAVVISTSDEGYALWVNLRSRTTDLTEDKLSSERDVHALTLSEA